MVANVIIVSAPVLRIGDWGLGLYNCFFEHIILSRYSAKFSTERMPWAAVKGQSIEHGFLPGECFVEKI